MRKSEFFVLGVLVFLDQLTKYLVSHLMELHQSIRVIGDFLRITHVHNTGAAWSMMSGFREGFIIAAAAVLVVLFAYLKKEGNLQKWLRYVIVVLMAGTCGNLIDRLIYGYVIDFIDTYPFGYDFPVFNVADICLTLGGAALVLSILLEKEHS
ncbi:MAG: signal peptidase II [Erysipelotrichaceae bacterium]|nr:signal peptidase II [Erysipelotrichaceae bacterium]